MKDAIFLLEAIRLLLGPLEALAAHLKGGPEPEWLAGVPLPLKSEIALARAKLRASIK